nr:hypothetical protein [Lachnospira eligens]
MFKSVEIVRTLRVFAFMYNKVLTVFLMNKGIVAMRAFERIVLGKS